MYKEMARSLSDFVQFNAKNRAKARILPLKLRKEPRLSENFVILIAKFYKSDRLLE